MFESAEIGHSIDKEAYDAEVPALREALLEAQYELKQQARFPVIVLINGIEGAGKGETVKLLNEWMDPRMIDVLTFDQQTDEEAGPAARLALLAGSATQGADGRVLWQLVQPDAAGAGARGVQGCRARSGDHGRRAPGADAVR